MVVTSHQTSKFVAPASICGSFGNPFEDVAQLQEPEKKEERAESKNEVACIVAS